MNPDAIWNQIEMHRGRIFAGTVERRRRTPLTDAVSAWKHIRKMYADGSAEPTGTGSVDADRVTLILYKTESSEVPPEPFDVIMDDGGIRWRVESVSSQFMNLRFHCFCVKG